MGETEQRRAGAPTEEAALQAALGPPAPVDARWASFSLRKICPKIASRTLPSKNAPGSHAPNSNLICTKSILPLPPPLLACAPGACPALWCQPFDPIANAMMPFPAASFTLRTECRSPRAITRVSCASARIEPRPTRPSAPRPPRGSLHTDSRAARRVQLAPPFAAPCDANNPPARRPRRAGRRSASARPTSCSGHAPPTRRAASPRVTTSQPANARASAIRPPACCNESHPAAASAPPPLPPIAQPADQDPPVQQTAHATRAVLRPILHCERLILSRRRRSSARGTDAGATRCAVSAATRDVGAAASGAELEDDSDGDILACRWASHRLQCKARHPALPCAPVTVCASPSPASDCCQPHRACRLPYLSSCNPLTTRPGNAAVHPSHSHLPPPAHRPAVRTAPAPGARPPRRDPHRTRARLRSGAPPPPRGRRSQRGPATIFLTATRLSGPRADGLAVPRRSRSSPSPLLLPPPGLRPP
ncbi:hypothetical protein CERSUDRAFT_93179 [Gelatoporia subvermispora B]|uniref:Uncharacterized protein n=1 Tax=Ceriporiopsis subvermispora (strain B) TaxID=914234 RepID=M2RKY5_CERS8|nr:hypothetical protein CERSUDRAFT_93179 [Gelatoporia subvermispora B]